MARTLAALPLGVSGEGCSGLASRPLLASTGGRSSGLHPSQASRFIVDGALGFDQAYLLPRPAALLHPSLHARGGVGLAWRVSFHSVLGAFCRSSAVPPPRGSWWLVLVCGSVHHGKSMRGLLPRSLPSPAPYNPARISGTRCSVFLGDLCRLRPGNTCCHSESSAAGARGGGCDPPTPPVVAQPPPAVHVVYGARPICRPE